MPPTPIPTPIPTIVPTSSPTAVPTDNPHIICTDSDFACRALLEEFNTYIQSMRLKDAEDYKNEFENFKVENKVLAEYKKNSSLIKEGNVYVLKLNTHSPTTTPSNVPTPQPTWSPTSNPTYRPTYRPTLSPTSNPTYRPTLWPTTDPTWKVYKEKPGMPVVGYVTTVGGGAFALTSIIFMYTWNYYNSQRNQGNLPAAEPFSNVQAALENVYADS